MIKTLMGSIRDYMKVTVATPLLVLGEVLSIISHFSVFGFGCLTPPRSVS